ncbi:MAG: recombination protein RecR [Elusimicrobia bacterium]|nr:recombination protein RecR [Elusimicrobiota bacterium]
MRKIPDILEKLVNSLSRLPGIGPRTAQRLAFYIVQSPGSEAAELSSAITEAKKKVHNCSECGGLTDKDPCDICRSDRRDHSVICVVEHTQDILALEASGEFSGLYHVLMGSLSPLDGIGPENLNIDRLDQRVKKGGVSELILATDPNVEGEATAAYIKEKFKKYNIKITRLAHGIPMGSNLEYADGVTLGKAIEGRREF